MHSTLAAVPLSKPHTACARLTEMANAVVRLNAAGAAPATSVQPLVALNTCVSVMRPLDQPSP
jgi:hypothetical protein